MRHHPRSARLLWGRVTVCLNVYLYILIETTQQFTAQRFTACAPRSQARRGPCEATQTTPTPCPLQIPVGWGHPSEQPRPPRCRGEQGAGGATVGRRGQSVKLLRAGRSLWLADICPSTGHVPGSLWGPSPPPRTREWCLWVREHGRQADGEGGSDGDRPEGVLQGDCGHTQRELRLRLEGDVISASQRH